MRSNRLSTCWRGAYAPDGAAVAYARVQYVIDGRYLKMQRADLQQYVLVDQRTTAIPGGGSDVNPSWQSADLLPPTSQVLPLPEYGRAGRMRVRWEGTDPGPSGLSDFDVEYATAAAGPWLPFVTDTKATAADLLLDQPGTTVWLRTRVRDQAGNVEAWPVKPDTQAQLYVWDVSGSAIDNRGITVPAGTWVSSPGALNTGASNSAGAYRAVHAVEGTYALDMKAPGFADSEPTQVRLNTDARLDFGLRPPGDVIENGVFENGASGWVGDGSIVQGDLAAGAHSGRNGLALGANCGFPCLSAPQLTGLPLGIYAAAADHFGNMHVALIVDACCCMQCTTSPRERGAPPKRCTAFRTRSHSPEDRGRWEWGRISGRAKWITAAVCPEAARWRMDGAGRAGRRHRSGHSPAWLAIAEGACTSSIIQASAASHTIHGSGQARRQVHPCS